MASGMSCLRNPSISPNTRLSASAHECYGQYEPDFYNVDTYVKTIMGGRPEGVKEAKERKGIELVIPKEIPRTDPPTEDELRILRSLDPDRRYTKAKEEGGRC